VTTLPGAGVITGAKGGESSDMKAFWIGVGIVITVVIIFLLPVLHRVKICLRLAVKFKKAHYLAPV
jgi:hypothetical protein